MKNIYYIIGTTFFLIAQFFLGSSPSISSIWEENEIAGIKYTLRYKPQEFEEFLQRVNFGNNNNYFDPILVKNKINLSTESIIDLPEDYRDERVFSVNLSNFDFKEDINRQHILNYFDRDLPNLGYINLEKSKNTSLFFEKLFGIDKPINKFVSLFRINANETDFISQDLDKIFEHFSRYLYFIRDMQQISARYDVVAAFLTVNLRNIESAQYIDNIGFWQRGKKTKDDYYKLRYRVYDDDMVGPMIMSVEL